MISITIARDRSISAHIAETLESFCALNVVLKHVVMMALTRGIVRKQEKVGHFPRMLLLFPVLSGKVNDAKYLR